MDHVLLKNSWGSKQYVAQLGIWIFYCNVGTNSYIGYIDES